MDMKKGMLVVRFMLGGGIGWGRVISVRHDDYDEVNVEWNNRADVYGWSYPTASFKMSHDGKVACIPG